jgi:hypothetical protein
MTAMPATAPPMMAPNGAPDESSNGGIGGGGLVGDEGGVNAGADGGGLEVRDCAGLGGEGGAGALSAFPPDAHQPVAPCPFALMPSHPAAHVLRLA